MLNKFINKWLIMRNKIIYKYIELFGILFKDENIIP